MGNLFDSASMAAGYAQARPPLHPRIIERIRAYLGLESPVSLALDIGCGAGLSTAPLKQLADFSVGLEPSKAMLFSNRLDRLSTCFVAGRAELLPFRSNSVDLATAAGSLNWADLDLFFDLHDDFCRNAYML